MTEKVKANKSDSKAIWDQNTVCNQEELLASFPMKTEESPLFANGGERARKVERESESKAHGPGGR